MDSQDIQAAISDDLVAFANSLADAHPDADLWEIADAILSGAVHWWLFANAPCDNPNCESCADLRTAELRMETLRQLTREMAESSEYFHSPNDDDVAHA